MADPVTLMAVAAAGGAILGGIGSIQQGEAQAQSLQSQANAARYNADVQRKQGEQEMAVANANANDQHRKAAQIQGKQAAAIAESGIGFSSTTNMLIDQSAAQAELDRQNILYAGNSKQQSLNQAANLSDYQANFAESQVGGARMAGYIGAASSLLNGAANYGAATKGKF